MKECIISLKDVEKSYSGVVALRLHGLELYEGDRAIVVGENGSGKSTLLRILAGLTRVSKGNDIRGKQWGMVPIGYLPQDGGIYRDLSIRQNLVVFERLVGGKSDPNQQTRIAAMLGVSEMLDRKVNDLSGGFKRLAGLYCLLASGAKALFLDEPFASLDQSKRDALEMTLSESSDRLSLLVISEHLNSSPTADESSSLWSKVVQLQRSIDVVIDQARVF
jgi:ABC-type multidrug transport system ATPase subunit